MRFLFAAPALAALAACTSPATGQEEGADTAAAEETAETEALADDPNAIADARGQVAALYDDWESVDMLSPPLQLSPRLSRLFSEERAAVEANGGAPNRLDFAWVVGGQDAEIADLEIDSEMAGPETLHVVASFTNFGSPTRVTYVFIRQEDGEWLVDDIRPLDPEGGEVSVAELLSGG